MNLITGTRYTVTTTDGDTFRATFTETKRTARGPVHIFTDDAFSLGAIGLDPQQIAEVVR